MLERHFHPPSNSLNLSEEELQDWAERGLQPIKDFQEIPLILVPAYFQCLSDATLSFPDSVRTAIQNWLKEARLDDERLRIERRFISHTPILIPDTAKGRQFFKLAKAIGDIPLNADIIPKNQNQGYWFKTLHYFWQAKGVVIAQRLLGVIPDPLDKGDRNEESGQRRALSNRLSDKNIESLHFSGAIYSAYFQLLVRGGRHIRYWARENKILYPFQSPQTLLLELLKEDFLVMWQLGPPNQEKKPLSKAQQRENVAVRVRLLQHSPWLEKGKGRRQNYQEKEQQYLEYLQQAGWSGYWLLALRPYIYEKRLEKYWKSYVKVLIDTKALAIDPLDWIKGQPFHRATSNVLRPVEATIDTLGCIHWQYVTED